jgi:glycosyltransferase involved in cell wall biosynthesis
VIVPTYNGAAYLPAALESMQPQLDDQIEVVAIDDGSTDSTLTILETYAARLPLRIVRREHVGNWVANSNHALSIARGRYVCFLHQDDLWLPARLAVLKQLTVKAPEATLYIHPVRYLDARGQDVGPWRCPLPAGRLSPPVVIERLLVQNFIAMPAPLFPRDKALEVGGLNEALWYTADWDFWLKMAACGPIVYHPRALAAFRIHAHSQTAQGIARAAEMRRQIEAVLDKHLPIWEALYPTRREVRAVARLAVELNYALATLVHGQRPIGRLLIWQLLGLGWEDLHRLLRDSRLLERVLARVRARWF